MGFFNHTCANCGHSVSNNANFCRACRAPQSEAWTTCDQCGSSVGADSDHCWKCSSNLKAQAERRIYDDRWQASPTDFAVRVVIRTPKATIRHGVEVGTGTLGLLFENGKLLDKLLPGYHPQDSLWQRLTGASQGDSVEVVLVNTRSAELDFAVHSMRDRAMIPVDGRLRLEFEVASVSDFVDTVVKQRPTLDAQDLVGLFQGDVEAALRGAVAECDIRELVTDIRARDRVAAPLRERLSPVLQRHGLCLVEVRLAQFGGQALEDLVERDGIMAQASLRADQEQAMRRFDKQIEMNLFTSELQLQEAMQATSHQFGLKQAEREHWTSLWKRQKAHELTLDDLAKEREMRMAEIDRRMAEDRKARGLEAEQNEHRRNEHGKDRDHDRDQNVKDAENFVAVDDIRHEHKKKKTQDALETLKQVEAMKQQRHEERLRAERENKILLARGFQGIETQAAMVASGATPEQLIELARLGAAAKAAPTAPPPPAPEPPAPAAAHEPAASPLVVSRVESCVGLLIVRNPEPDPRVVHVHGSCFVVAESKVATTAHQAEQVRQAMLQGMTVSIIFPDRECQVKGVSRHPGFSTTTTGPQDEPPVAPLFDVAVLSIDSAFATHLTLADGVSLSKGQRVFYVGYPVEEVRGGVNLHRPQAWFKDGTLGSITDFWGGTPLSQGQALLLNHSCPMAGGASGSPLCTPDGQVIGIVSARNMRETFHQDEHGNMAVGKQTSAVQTNYAQRIDLLDCLL